MTSTTRVDTAAAQKGIWSLPREVLSTHILSTEFLPEPADLGRLRAVSHAMRDAVDATGREIKRLLDQEAAFRGHVSLLKDRHRRGVLGDERWLCAAAARKGDLEELKALRVEKFPWDWRTCAGAAAVSTRVAEGIADGNVRVVCASCARALCLCSLNPREISLAISSDVTTTTANATPLPEKP